MARRKRPPSYPKRPHKRGQARVEMLGQTFYLGTWGSPESHVRYRELCRRYTAGEPLADPPERSASAAGAADLVAVSHVLASFLAAAETGQPVTASKRPTTPKELGHFRRAVAVALSVHGSVAANDFDAGRLEDVQAEMVRLAWDRRHVDRQVVRLRTIFRWAERRRLVPRGTWENLRTLESLERGVFQGTVSPVPEKHLTASLAKLGVIPKAMANLQLWTGARPGEVVKLRGDMIQREGEVVIGEVSLKLGKVWAADFGFDHKTGWRGLRKLILLGPRAQEVVRPFLAKEPTGFLFDPKQAPHSHTTRDTYTVWTFGQAIDRACDKAGVPHWDASQLRHNAATRLASEFGPEVARVILGHRHLSTTRIYLEDDMRRAAEAVEKAG